MDEDGGYNVGESWKLMEDVRSEHEGEQEGNPRSVNEARHEGYDAATRTWQSQ